MNQLKSAEHLQYFTPTISLCSWKQLEVRETEVSLGEIGDQVKLSFEEVNKSKAAAVREERPLKLQKE